MNREDIIRMAQDAGFYGTASDFYMQTLEHFAALIASAEREACAKICETLGVHSGLNVYAGGPDWYKHGKDCAKAIRARRQA